MNISVCFHAGKRLSREWRECGNLNERGDFGNIYDLLETDENKLPQL